MPAASTISLTSSVVRISRRSGCVGDRLGEPLAQRAREVLGQPARRTPAVSGRSEASTRACRSSLACATSVGQLRAGQPGARRLQRREPGLVGQHLQLPVDARGGPRGRRRTAGARGSCPVACARPTPSSAFCARLSSSTSSATSSVISASSALRASRSSSPAATSRSSRILMLTSWSLQSTPAELSIASVLILPAGAGELDAAALGQPEVAALADDLDAQLAAVGADRVVGLVARRRRGSRRWP